LLISILITSGIKPVKADPFVITIYAALDATEPYIGWNAGYHDVMQALKVELAKIGINLELTFWDSGTIWDTVWESYWNKPGEPPTGWDLATGEQWLYLTGLTWMGAFVYKESLGPSGNIGPWLNLKADEIYHKAEAELDPAKRKQLLYKWQELYMHDAPAINLFYTKQYEVQPKWFYGYDYSACYGDWRWNTRLEETSSGHYGSPNKPNATFTFCIDETMYAGVNPIFMETYGTEAYSAMAFDVLYACTRYPYPPTYNDTLWDPDALQAYPYVMAPQAASGMPVYRDGGTTVYVPLRNDTYWVWPKTDLKVDWSGPEWNKTLNAYDVKWTFDATIDPKTGASDYGDYAPVIESVEVPSDSELNAAGLLGDYNYTEQQPERTVYPWTQDVVDFSYPYVAKFNLKRTHADFELLFGVVWGGTILPRIVFEGVENSALRSHPTQFDVDLLPQTGPFILTSYTPDDQVVFHKNPHWWGTSNGYLNTIDTYIIKFIVDPVGRKTGLFAGDFEVCEAPIAHVDEFEALDRNKFNVYTEPRANTAQMIRFNLNNPILANRYVRMAIAHAIPYSPPASPNIPDIIRGWGLTCDFLPHAVPLTEAIFPLTILGGEYCYHPPLEPYGYDLDKARYYLNLYLNQTNGTPALGPVGDADQSGLVDATDWGLWRTSPVSCGSTMSIYPTWPYTIDPDWDNDDDADSADKALWGNNYGIEYYA